MYEIVKPGVFEAVPLIVAFDGWVDAAGVGSGAVERIAGASEVLVRFDPDAIFDYRVNRPVVDFIDGKLSDVRYPEVTIKHAQVGGTDLLVMGGTEPEFRWLELGRSMVELSESLGIGELVCVGSVPAAVAHTRPTSILHTSSTGAFSSLGERIPDGLLRVPGAAVTNIEWHLARHGLPTYGFWAQVPHYVSGPFHQGIIALLDRVGRHLQIDVPLGSLVEDAIAQRDQLDTLADSNPEVRTHLERLEMLADPDDLPTAEELGSEIERFLRESGDDA